MTHYIFFQLKAVPHHKPHNNLKFNFLKMILQRNLLFIDIYGKYKQNWTKPFQVIDSPKHPILIPIEKLEKKQVKLSDTEQKPPFGDRK